MTKKLFIQSIAGFAFLIFAMGAALFITAGSFQYWQGWLFLSSFGISALFITLYLMKNDPKLLEKRVKAGPTAEKETKQKIIQTITAVGFILMLILPGLDYRFGWSSFPTILNIIGDTLVVVGFYIIFLVFKENSFTSATIRTYSDQKVITTGPYSLIRHPMYFGALIMFAGMILSLNSWTGALVFVIIFPALIWRLFDEEKILTADLEGYKEYMKKVHRHLVPFIW